MAKTIVIDPITRIEGHMKLEVKVDGGKVVEAHSSGTMFRGLEISRGATRATRSRSLSASVASVLPLTASPALSTSTTLSALLRRTTAA